MLFNSYVFLLLFLPTVTAGFYLLARRDRSALALSWLVLASLFFYGWWNPKYLLLIAASIALNYGLSLRIQALGPNTAAARWMTGIGIVANLLTLAYFKYTGFLLENLGAVTGTDYGASQIILPLAISFFTFQQISFLADCYAGKVERCDFLRYALFVTFFPQLIAGPIVHHSEMMPQFRERPGRTRVSENLAVGSAIFTIGLFKKVVLADSVAVYATPVFAAADGGTSVTLFEAWSGAIAYTFQIYFDFSGYSDMAIGLARLFGIRLPLNFDSPYKALNIVDFWRRWHMTLSRFLRDYVYIPLGGNRNGDVRRYANLMIVMLVGGLWHGAGWNFIIWGGLHGAYLMVNHGWAASKKRLPFSLPEQRFAYRLACRVATLLAVMVAWVFFRAETLSGAVDLLRSMVALNGVSVPTAVLPLLAQLPVLGSLVTGSSSSLLPAPDTLLLFTALLLISWCLPNTQELFRAYRPAFDFKDSALTGSYLEQSLAWRPTASMAVLMLCIGLYTLQSMTGISEFLYFQF